MNKNEWTHAALQHDLAEHLMRPERMLWEDMLMGPSGSPRPDVFTMRKSYSDPRPISYEIKVSVADYRRDVTSGKWQTYLNFSSGVIFCVPVGLITKDDLPPRTGLMTRSGKGWRTVKAPTLKTIKLPESVLLKLLIDGLPRAESAARTREISIYQANKQIRDQLGDEVASVVKNIEDAKNRIKHFSYERERMTTQHETRLNHIKKRALRCIDTTVMELSQALGLPPDTDPSDLARAARRFRQSANSAQLIEHAMKVIDNASSLLSGERRELAALLPDKETGGIGGRP